MRGWRAVGAVAVCAVLLSGCARVHELRPVIPDVRTKVRMAALDVLNERAVVLRDSPQCRTVSAGAVRCDGTTIDDEPVDVRSTGDSPLTMTIRIDGDVVFDGAVDAVIQDDSEAS